MKDQDTLNLIKTIANLVKQKNKLIDASTVLIDLHHELSGETDEKVIHNAFDRWDTAMTKLEEVLNQVRAN